MVAALPYARPTFVETQRLVARGSGRGTATVVVVILGLPAAHAVWISISRPGTWPIGAAAVLLLLGVAAITLLASSTTVVEAGELRLSMTLGTLRIWRRVVPLSTVIACQVVEPGGPMTARPGWHLMKLPGVAVLKFFGGDTYFMVRRNQPAVVLAFGGFKGLVVGSHRPHELADAINAVISPIPAKVS